MQEKEEESLWYRLKLKNKGIREEAKQQLSASSFTCISLYDLPPAECPLQYLAKEYELYVYVQARLTHLLAFINAHAQSKYYRLARNTHNTPIVYDSRIVQQTQQFFQHYTGLFSKADKTPPQVIPCTLDYQELHAIQGYYKRLQRTTIDKFYFTLLEDTLVFIPVPKGTLPEEAQSAPPFTAAQEQSLHKDWNTPHWMILRTYHEMEWLEILKRWNTEMKAAIQCGEVSPCTPYVPMRKHKDRNGKEQLKPLCHGYLFIKTPASNLVHLVQNKKHGIAAIAKALLTREVTQAQSPSLCTPYQKAQPVTIPESTMTTFIFANDTHSDEVEYETFDYSIDEHVMYTNADSAFYGHIGILSRKRKQLYLAFTLSKEVKSQIAMPAIKVTTAQIRKLTEEEQKALQ